MGTFAIQKPSLILTQSQIWSGIMIPFLMMFLMSTLKLAVRNPNQTSQIMKLYKITWKTSLWFMPALTSKILAQKWLSSEKESLIGLIQLQKTTTHNSLSNINQMIPREIQSKSAEQ